MRLILKFLTAIIFFLVGSLFADPSLAGAWEGIDSNGNKIHFLFQQNDRLTIVINGRVAGGEGSPDVLTYKTDFNQKPAELDIISSKNQKEKVVKVIIKMIDDYRLILYSTGDGSARPEKYGFKDPKNLLILFKKVDN